MNWSNYFRKIETMYKIKIDSTIRSTIINQFTEEYYLFTEEDIFELSRKNIQSYLYSKINNNKIKK